MLCVVPRRRTSDRRSVVSVEGRTTVSQLSEDGVRVAEVSIVERIWKKVTCQLSPTARTDEKILSAYICVLPILCAVLASLRSSRE